MVNPNINSFAQTPVQGQLDLSQVGGNVVAARVSNNIGNGVTLVAGQAVKIDTTAPATNFDGIPPVLPLAADTDISCGFVKYDIKSPTFGANARLELAMSSVIMYMTADTASIPTTRFQALEYDFALNTVRPWAGINPVIGFAYDAAVLAGDLIRVWITNASFAVPAAPALPKNISITATLAQINAGLTLIAGITGKKITVTNYTARVAGNFATGTAVLLESTNGTPVLVSTIAETALTTGAVLLPSDANTTLGAGFAVPLGTSDGLKVANSGSAQTAGTSVQFNITYTQS